VARSGNYEASYAALAALGEIGGGDATSALGDLLQHAPTQLATQAAYALAQSGSEEARSALIAAARADGNNRAAALSALGQLGGDEVEDVFLEVAKSGALRDRQTALQHLVS